MIKKICVIDAGLSMVSIFEIEVDENEDIEEKVNEWMEENGNSVSDCDWIEFACLDITLGAKQW